LKASFIFRRELIQTPSPAPGILIFKPLPDPNQVTYVKYGSHEMDEEEDFKRIYTALVDIDRQLGKANWARSIQSPV
jgi:hypothetical protein